MDGASMLARVNGAWHGDPARGAGGRASHTFPDEHPQVRQSRTHGSVLTSCRYPASGIDRRRRAMPALREVFMARQLSFVWCCVMLALSSACRDDGVQPIAAVDAVLNAFDDHPIVALSEMHGMQEEHDFIQRLLRDASFPDRVDAVVMEGGNALYQDLLDGYIIVGDVPLSDVRIVWRNSSQSPNSIWDAEVFEQIYTTIHDVNMTLPAADRVRVLAGGVPIDWSDIETAEDMGRYRMSRDEYYASVVETEVLARGQSALLIIGGMHILKASNGQGDRLMVTQRLEALHPGSVFVVWPHTGLLGAEMDREYLSADELAAGGAARMTTRLLEARMASWPTPSATLVEGTWLGDLELSLFLPGGFTFDGEYVSPQRDYGGLTLSEGIDAYLYVGPRDSLTLSRVAPAVLEDDAYLEELNRRSQLRFGRPFDPRSLNTERRTYFSGVP